MGKIYNRLTLTKKIGTNEKFQTVSYSATVVTSLGPRPIFFNRTMLKNTSYRPS